MAVLQKTRTNLFIFLFLTGMAFVGSMPVVYGQQATVELGRNRLPINEYFTISIRLRNLPKPAIGEFPEIEGFKKSTRNSTTSQIGIGNKTIIEQTITQNYAAYQEGKFPLKPFSIEVNGKNISSRGTTITIEPMATEPAEAELAPEQPEPPVILSAPAKPFKTQSFLSVETDKKEVYVGEGFYVRLAFYLAEGEQEQLDFYNFEQQFPELLKQLRQQDTWEEVVASGSEIIPDTIAIGGKPFLKYTLHRRVLYPLNSNSLEFKPIILEMSRRPAPDSYAPVTQPTELVSFTSRVKNIKVKSLPPHPLREVVPVGQYRLQEGIDRKNFKTGQSFTYQFNVVGEGNLGTLASPDVPPLADLEIYPPDIRLIKNNAPGLVQGTKSFRYVMLAKAAGEYPLKKIFRLIFFNTSTQRYDTLQSGLVLRIRGIEKGLANTDPEDVDPFYRLIGEEDNLLVDLNQLDEIKFYTNVVILFLICVSLVLFYKKK